MGRLTLYGMLQYDPTLFDDCVLPSGYNKEALIDEILTKSGELYPYYQQPIMLKRSMRLWFSRNFLNFDRIMAAITTEYSPIENYDRYEDTLRTPNLHDNINTGGSDVVERQAGQSVTDTKTGSDTLLHSYDLTQETNKTGTDSTDHNVSAFDSDTYSPSYQDTQTLALKDTSATGGTQTDTTTFNNTQTSTKSGIDTDTTSYGKSETVSHTGTEAQTAHVHGNIGVTTNQQMITSEIELRKYDVYTDIAMRFEKEFLMQLY